jgi:hypothetical protein
MEGEGLMRIITTHQTNECNKQLALFAEDRNENGVTQAYFVKIPRVDVVQTLTLPFQYGPIAEAGVNGMTLEVLLAICIDQLEGYQSSKFANDYNKEALHFCRYALDQLEARTREREARGVEGTHKL